uniref:Uncharacterized protein n=1 Tax=Anguilla anguilla TaxID=7936 RepID=A0A0E9UZ00_ANGAN
MTPDSALLHHQLALSYGGKLQTTEKRLKICSG